MDDFLTFLKLLAAICGVLVVIKVYRDSLAKHPVFTYEEHSTQNEADWRWRKPDAELGLSLTDDEQKSCLRFPVKWLFFQKIMVVVGYMGIGFVLFGYVMLLIRNAGWGDYLVSLLFVFLSLAFLNVGSRVSSLTLYADHLVVIVRYGFVLQHTYVYQHNPKMHFDGRPESMFELTVEHEEPDFKLYVTRPGFLFLSRRKRFIVSANQSQGSWLVAGLNDWCKHAGLSRPDTQKMDKPA
jgi:hypothetical protein